MTDEEILNYYKWEVNCESPFNIRNSETGDVATGDAAYVMKDELRSRYKNEADDILNLEFYVTGMRLMTIREFFYELLATLWEEQEGFSGKRPFGNGGWDIDLIICLVKHDLISGKLDRTNGLDDYDQDEVNKFVIERILKPLFEIE